MKIKRLTIVASMIILMILSGFTGRKAKVLIIGDSISIGYTSFVKKELDNKAIITHNPGNAQHTGYGLENIENWIQHDDYDIIQFNWGLWDICYRNPDSKVQGNRDKINGKQTFTLEEYRKNLEKIVKILKEKTNARLIFVTTSYVPKEEAGRFEKDAVKYNKIAKQVMKQYSVQVNDIYKKSKTIHEKYGLGNDDVHYQTKGYEELGKEIASFLNTEI
jgi:hypothetical protein